MIKFSYTIIDLWSPLYLVWACFSSSQPEALPTWKTGRIQTPSTTCNMYSELLAQKCIYTLYFLLLPYLVFFSLKIFENDIVCVIYSAFIICESIMYKRQISAPQLVLTVCFGQKSGILPFLATVGFTKFACNILILFSSEVCYPSSGRVFIGWSCVKI